MAMSEFTLHGRPLNVGDKVWSDIWRCWSDVANIPVSGAWSTPKYISNNQHAYAWDEPPAVDLASIPPPLCWIEGHPVRKGSAMMTKAGIAVIIEKFDGGSLDRLIVSITNHKGHGYVCIDALTFALPPNTRPISHAQVMAGYAVACKYGILEKRAFDLADEMWSAFHAKESA